MIHQRSSAASVMYLCPSLDTVLCHEIFRQWSGDLVHVVPVLLVA